MSVATVSGLTSTKRPQTSQVYLQRLASTYTLLWFAFGNILGLHLLGTAARTSGDGHGRQVCFEVVSRRSQSQLCQRLSIFIHVSRRSSQVHSHWHSKSCRIITPSLLEKLSSNTDRIENNHWLVHDLEIRDFTLESRS